MGCHFLLQGIFPTQGSKLDLPHCRQMLLPSELGKSVIGIRKVYLEINTEKKNLFKQSWFRFIFFELDEAVILKLGHGFWRVTPGFEREGSEMARTGLTLQVAGKINHNARYILATSTEVSLLSFLPSLSLSLWKASKYHAHTTILWGKQQYFGGKCPCSQNLQFSLQNQDVLRTTHGRWFLLSLRAGNSLTFSYWPQTFCLLG